MVAPEFLCMKRFDEMRRNKHGSIYYTYPQENKNGLELGHKKIIHEAKKRPQTPEECWAEDIEYYFENDLTFPEYKASFEE